MSRKDKKGTTMFKKADSYFTDKMKAVWAVGAFAFALLFAVLWNLFPMVFYSVFFANTVGSYVLLALISLVVLLPLFWLFTKLSKTDLSFCMAVPMNVIPVIAVEFVFSVFFFSDARLWCIVAVAVHSLLNILTFGFAEIRGGKAPKGMNAPAPKGERVIKKQPVLAVVWAVAYSFVADVVSFLIFYAVAQIFMY